MSHTWIINAKNREIEQPSVEKMPNLKIFSDNTGKLGPIDNKSISISY